MRTLSLAVGLFLLTQRLASAETPYQCDQAQLSSLKVAAARDGFVAHALVDPGSTLDPLAHGLTVELFYEPETDPANQVFSATLPASGFAAVPGGARYHSASGAIGGITLARVRNRPDGRTRVDLLRRTGGPIAGLSHAGKLRVVVSSAGSCARSCGSPCDGSLRCRRSSDTALCGILSGCEMLNAAGKQCLLPYPSSHFLRDDPTTATGERLAYPRRGMPANAAGVHVDPVKWDSLDGYSPGTIGMAVFPQGVDLLLSNTPSLLNYGASVDPGSPTVLLDADTGERIEHFAENDVSIAPGGIPVAPPKQIFMVRPGRRLRNGGHYIVALRNLVAVGGTPIQPEPAFKALRDGTPSGSAALEARRDEFDAIFAKLETAGVARSSLILAWQFTVASDDDLQRWLVSMRDQTFAQLGPDNAPPFAVTLVEDNPFNDPRVCRRVRGTYTVPLFTTFNGPGSLLNLDPLTNLPMQNGVAADVPFTVMIPCSLVNPTPHAGRPVFYGHGLLGTGFGEVTAGNLRTLANTYGFVIAATDWQGMANADLPTVFGFIGDFSDFAKLPERLHQGVLNQLVLGRLLGASNGLSSDPAFKFDDGMGNQISVIDPSEVFYYGNSQGGIFGGTVMALAQETTRGVLGVPGANFSTLLQRSRDFNPYFDVLRIDYPDDTQRMMTYALIQQLWDRAEPNGWYHRTLSNPLPNTPAHKVLVLMATNDDEVSNVATEIMVRTMGMPQVTPVVKSYYHVPEQAAPFDGSAMFESDEGDAPMPLTNIPPADNNAHGAMRGRPAIQATIDRFLRTGGDVEQFCSGSCNPE